MTVMIEEGPNPTTNRNDSAVLGVNKSFQLKRKWPSGQEPGAGGLMGGRPAPPPLYKDGTTSGADPTLALLLRSASSGQPLRQWNPTEPGGAAEAACARALAWLSTVNLRLQSWLAAMQTYCPPSLRLAEHIPQGTLWLALGLFRRYLLARGQPPQSVLSADECAALAGALWVAIKYLAEPTLSPGARLMAAATGQVPGLLVAMERKVLGACGWDLLGVLHEAGLREAPAEEEAEEGAGCSQQAPPTAAFM